MGALEELVTTPGFTQKLKIGKYSRWAVRLHASSLVELLQAIGKYGAEISAIRRTSGSFPELRFISTSSRAAWRMQLALESIATIQVTGSPEGVLKKLKEIRYMSTARGYPAGEPVFVPDFRERLSMTPDASWAQDLDPRTFVLLLWMVGEYGARSRWSMSDGIEYNPPLFDGEPERVRQARISLVSIAKVHGDTQVPCRGER